MTRLIVDGDQIRTFAEAVFRYASDGQTISLRIFPDDGEEEEALSINPVKVNGHGLVPVIEAAIAQAQRAADCDRRAVFCPPLGGFKDGRNAKEVNLTEGYTLSVDCDQRPDEARQKLEGLLGPATITAASGGVWTDPETGECQDKVHLHWRLNEPAIGEDLSRLKLARRIAAEFVGADTTNVTIVHPIRWPGSWHRKNEPKLARIVSITENEIDVRDALELLERVRPERTQAHGGTADEGQHEDRQDPRPTAELIANITSGEQYHPSLVPLSARLIRSGMTPGAVVNFLRAIMEQVPPERRDGLRWYPRFDSIPQIVTTAEEKFGTKQESTPPGRIIKSSSDFVRDFIPPDYQWDGILQRRFCYSLTGGTGSLKTGIALLLAASTALGRSMSGRLVEQGRVIYFAGENPDDIRMRWIAMAEHMGFDIETIDVHFIPGVFSIDELEARVREEVEALCGAALVIIDTSAAYFPGDGENDNVQMGAHARRLRNLATLPGGPTVLALCHPVKNASADNLLPRGGGAFLNEVDGNLTAARSGTTTTLHWQGKFRGPDFEPMAFEQWNVTAAALKDSKGRPVPTVIARALTAIEQQAAASQERTDEDALLILLLESVDGHLSLAAIATALRWLDKKGEPYKSKVVRSLKRLEKEKLVTALRGSYDLTEKGKSAAKKAKYNRDAAGATYG
jgi:hypothetical protein